MRRSALVSLFLLAGWFVPALHGEGIDHGVIQKKSGGHDVENARSFLNSDVVDLEFRVEETTLGENRFTARGYQSPVFNQKIQTLSRGKLGDWAHWENGIDLSVHRGNVWDGASRETLQETWRPEYRTKVGVRPWQKGEFELQQRIALENVDSAEQRGEFWRSSLHFKQQIMKSSELRLEAAHEEKSRADDPSWSRESFAAFWSQDLGTRDWKLRLGAREGWEQRSGTQLDDRSISRREAGLEWKTALPLTLYGGTALEEERRPIWEEDESLLFYEFRSRWTPDPRLQFSGGLSLDSRQENSDSESGRTKWFLGGDIKADSTLSFHTQLRWDQWQRRSATREIVDYREKFTLGAGPRLQLDESTRLSAEYGMASEHIRNEGGESLVEHMLSFVLSADF